MQIFQLDYFMQNLHLNSNAYRLFFRYNYDNPGTLIIQNDKNLYEKFKNDVNLKQCIVLNRIIYCNIMQYNSDYVVIYTTNYVENYSNIICNFWYIFSKENLFLNKLFS